MLLLFATLGLAKDKPKKIVLFGDSLSDDGGGTRRLYNQWPYPPYSQGRYSNGPVWIEYLPSPQTLNFAYGGSSYNQTLVIYAPSIATQINDYLRPKRFRADAESQYIIFAGANDVAFAWTVESLTDNGTYGDLEALKGRLVLLVMEDVRRLVTAGAKEILISGIPDLSSFPGFVAAATPAQGAALARLIKYLNEEIYRSVLSFKIKREVRGVDLRFFDIFGLFDKIASNPHGYGLENMTSPCLGNWPLFGQRGANGIGSPQICADPDKFFFWDGWHPTTKVHGLIAEAVMKFLDWPR